MAGFDLDKQRAYTLPGGGRGEAGRIDFDAGSYCQAIATTMVSLYAWHADPGIDVSAPGASLDLNSTELGLTCDIGDITNGNIIVKRQTNRADVSASWYYEVKGW
jgi:hypothetical protein